MFRVLVGALGALALAWPAAAQVAPFPDDFRTQEITKMTCDDSYPGRRSWAGGRTAPRIRRHRRHVGAFGYGAGGGPYRGGA